MEMCTRCVLLQIGVIDFSACGLFEHDMVPFLDTVNATRTMSKTKVLLLVFVGDYGYTPPHATLAVSPQPSLCLSVRFPRPVLNSRV